jgi:hypothetical protein
MTRIWDRFAASMSGLLAPLKPEINEATKKEEP